MFAIALVGLIENVLFMLFLGIMLIAGLLLWHGWLPSWLWWVWLFYAASFVIGAVQGVLEAKDACEDDQIQ